MKKNIFLLIVLLSYLVGQAQTVYPPMVRYSDGSLQPIDEVAMPLDTIPEFIDVTDEFDALSYAEQDTLLTTGILPFAKVQHKPHGIKNRKGRGILAWNRYAYITSTKYFRYERNVVDIVRVDQNEETFPWFLLIGLVYIVCISIRIYYLTYYAGEKRDYYLIAGYSILTLFLFMMFALHVVRFAGLSFVMIAVITALIALFSTLLAVLSINKIRPELRSVYKVSNFLSYITIIYVIVVLHLMI